ncbi:MAG: hypothetical protein ACM3NI_11685 [Bacteroidota bacterium]
MTKCERKRHYTPRRSEPPDFLDETMTRADIDYVLTHLEFHGEAQIATLQLNHACRDYLLHLLRGR